jgi:UDP-glucose 4-epimerase
MSNRVLVTGGAGFIGSHLVDCCVQAGFKVTVLDDFSSGHVDNLSGATASGDVRIVSGSILDADSLQTAMEDCNQVFHLAVRCVRSSIGRPRESHDTNATGTLTVLEAARRSRIERFVYCSSSEVYGNVSSGLLNEDTTPCRPATIYGGAKLAGEVYTHAYYETYGLPTLVVRPFNAFGPRAHIRGDLAEVVPRFVIRVLNGRPPVIFGDGTNGRDFTYVTDVARGIWLAGTSDKLVGKCTNIAYGRMITVREVAEAIIGECGRNDLSVCLSRPRPGDVKVLAADTRRASEVLGYRAEIEFVDGIRRYVGWFCSRYFDVAALLEDEIENWALPSNT